MTLDDLRRGLADPQMRGLNLAQLMDDLDRNQDGRLEYTEFIAAAMDQKLHENEALKDAEVYRYILLFHTSTTIYVYIHTHVLVYTSVYIYIYHNLHIIIEENA